MSKLVCVGLAHAHPNWLVEHMRSLSAHVVCKFHSWLMSTFVLLTSFCISSSISRSFFSFSSFTLIQSMASTYSGLYSAIVITPCLCVLRASSLLNSRGCPVYWLSGILAGVKDILRVFVKFRVLIQQGDGGRASIFSSSASLLLRAMHASNHNLQHQKVSHEARALSAYAKKCDLPGAVSESLCYTVRRPACLARLPPENLQIHRHTWCTYVSENVVAFSI